MSIKKAKNMILRIVNGVLALGILLASTGCSYINNEDSKKIILKEDVRETSNEETPVQVEVQQLDIKLDEGGFFNPAFYYNGELYGSVTKGFGMADKSLEKYPIAGLLKKHLYSLDKNNALKETNKRVFYVNPGSKVIAVDKACSKNDQSTGKIVSIDYRKEDEPEILEDLNETLKTVPIDSFTAINKTTVDENKKVYSFSAQLNGLKLYFYDADKGKLYSKSVDDIWEADINYITALKAFIYIDDNYKCSKLVFEGDTFDFKEYIDLKSLMQAEEGTNKNIGCIPINDEEVLIL